jgi:hypothetical protein
MKRNEIIGEIKANPDYLRAAERSRSQSQATQRTFGKSSEEKAAARRKEINRDKGIAGYSKRHRKENPDMYPKVKPRDDMKGSSGPQDWYGQNRYMGDSIEEGLEEGASDYVGDAIEGLRMAKPGLEKEDFLDELYSYIDAEMGMEAAERAFADKGSYDDWYDSYADAVDENANMLKVAKDDDKQTILQNPSTGVQTQIDKSNPNAPRLTQDDQGKLKLAAPMGAGGQQQQQQQKPTLVGKDVEVATESADLTAMLRIAGLR